MTAQESNKPSLANEKINDGAWPKMLIDIRDHMEFTFKENGQSPESALNLASQAVIALANHIGGTMLYLPRGDSLKRALRDAEIHQLFNGENTNELAKKYGLGRPTIYAILQKQRELRKSKI